MTPLQRTSISQLFDLTGKVAIVTDGALGIGQAIACRLAEAGASVMIADVNLEAAQDTAKQIQVRGGMAKVTQADASSVRDAKRTVEETVQALGRLDILTNTPLVYPIATALEVTEALWDKALDITFKGLFFYSQAAAQEIVHEGHAGKIINVASPTGHLQHFDASKAGVVTITGALALEFGPHNISVNAIAPGGVRTPDVAGVSPSDERYREFVAHIPLRRMGGPDDIANVALFLASSASDYMTGTVVAVDGGGFQSM
jgi:2-dehydro-3-deoxy-D-gluconate 5-dehydrogenase